MKNNLCKCGCGNLCKLNYLKGHGRRGKKNNVEHNKKIGLANRNKIITEEQINRLKLYNINKKHTVETKQKLSKIAKEKEFGLWMKGRKLSEETRKKISDSNKGHIVSEETKQKIRETKMGELNPMFNKTHSEDYKEKLRNNIANVRKNAYTLEAIEKRRKKLIGKKLSDETKRKMRLSAIKHIKEKNNGFRTMHNIIACRYLDELSNKMNLKLQHALNGGEYYISYLGYFVDGYDFEKNIVIEYDEPLHYNRNGLLKNKDVIRQKQIIEHLNCKFYRYNEKKGELYEVS